MTIKKFALLIAAMLCVISVEAQQSKTDASVEFRPHWDLQLQGGVGYTVGESSAIGDLVSPALSLSTTYRFHPAMGVRFGLGGWQGRGVVVLTDSNYAFKFMQLNADYKLDLCTLFGGYNHRRVVGVYAFAGAGLNYGFNNEEATALAVPGVTELSYLWDSKAFVAGRFGLGADFRVGERWSLSLEANANVLSDHFNSKRADNCDWQLNCLAGVSYSLGKKHQPSQKWADEQKAIEAAEALRQQEAEAARKAAEEEAARKAAEEEAARKAEAERKAAEARAIAVRKANIEKNSNNVFFTVGSAVVRESEAQKINALAQWLKENNDYRVMLVGYADKETGTPNGNLRLSQRRAEAVKSMLVKAGIAESRIDSNFKGDTVQPFEKSTDNRVVICTLE